MRANEVNDKGIVLFGNEGIRRVLVDGEWFFSVVDIVGVLTESLNARDYWYHIKSRELKNGIELSTICRQLKMKSSDGKMYFTDCANLKGIFRIIQSIPSKRAEPFKLWLAKVGSDRIEEIENPELAQDRARGYYEKKGYPGDWIDKRMRGVAIRQDLTNEWKNRGVKEGGEFAILTDEIARATFGVSIREHKEIKNLDEGLKNVNLRDSMTDLELIFNMLGEKVSTEITKERDSDGFGECRECAREGGEVAGNARRDAEERIGKGVVSGENYLDIVKKKRGKVKVAE